MSLVIVCAIVLGINILIVLSFRMKNAVEKDDEILQKILRDTYAGLIESILKNSKRLTEVEKYVDKTNGEDSPKTHADSSGDQPSAPHHS